MDKAGRLYIISAPSGTGKSTVISRIIQLRRDLLFSVSVTTRPKREGEMEGVSYYYVSHNEFERMIADDEFLEYAKYVDNFYGTPRIPVVESMNAGRDIIADIDVQGAMQIKERIPEAIAIFIIPPDMEELERRLRSRGTDSEERTQRRLERAKAEFLELEKYDYIVVNDIVDRAAAQILKIIEMGR